MFGFGARYRLVNFVGLLFVLVFLLLLGVFFVFGFSQTIFNPPYLAFVLQLFFVFGTGLAVAFVSAKSYVQTGAPNILLLGNAILISSLSFTISATMLTPEFPPTLTSNQAVIIGNVGVLISSLVLLVSAIVTWLGTKQNPRVPKKTMLALSFLISIATVTVISVLSALDLFPVFLTSNGPTLLRLVVLALTTIFYFASSVLFGWQYVRTKSQVVYWFWLALALFGTAYLAGVLTVHLGSAMTWVSRLALYLSGAFLLFALLGPEGKTHKQPYTAKWSEAFRSDQKQMETFISKIAEGFAYCKIITDAKGNPVDWLYLDVNDSYEQINDADRNKVVGRKATEVLPGIREDPSDWINVYGHVALTGEPIVLERFSKDRNKWYRVSTYSPQKGYFVSLFEDITRRKKAEESLKQSEERFHNVFEQTALGIAIGDMQGRVIESNSALEQMLGYSKEEMQGKPFSDFTHQEDVNMEWELVRELTAGKRDHYEIEKRYIRKNGEVIWVHLTGGLMSGLSREPLGVATVENITERKKAEEALKESEIKFKTAADFTFDWEYWIAPDGNLVYISPSCERITGYKSNEFMENPDLLNEIVHPEDRTAFSSHSDLAREGKGLQIDFRIIDRNNEVRWISHVCQPVFDKQGNWIGRRVSNREISKRKKAEEKLEEYSKDLERKIEERTKKLEQSATYVRSLIEASLDPLVTINAKGKITDVNEATAKVTGFSRDHLIGSDFSDYFTEPQKAKAGYRKVFTDGFVKDYPLAIRNKSGEISDVLYNATIYRNEKGEIEGVFAAARDVTERKKLEKQVQDSERLAAIGATAGMVGHDIRNPLQAITGDLYLVKTELDELPDHQQKKNALESLDEIQKNIDYINKIVADLQDYARPLNPRTQETDLTSVFNEMLTKNGIPENVKVTIDVEDQARNVMADADYLNRIFYNLVTNAVQAMPNGGKLMITAHTEANDIVVAVKDTGVGIPKEIQGKMFTPMFTTKSKGQGFGLPVVKRMTESLGGTVTFESKEGKGTTFFIRLPLKKYKS